MVEGEGGSEVVLVVAAAGCDATEAPKLRPTSRDLDRDLATSALLSRSPSHTHNA